MCRGKRIISSCFDITVGILNRAFASTTLEFNGFPNIQPNSREQTVHHHAVSNDGIKGTHKTTPNVCTQYTVFLNVN